MRRDTAVDDRAAEPDAVHTIQLGIGNALTYQMNGVTA